MFFIGLSTSILSYVITVTVFCCYLLFGKPIGDNSVLHHQIITEQINTQDDSQIIQLKKNIVKKICKKNRIKCSKNILFLIKNVINKSFNTFNNCDYSRKLIILSAGINSPPKFA